MKNKVGIAGLILGMLAITSAFLSPWIMDLASPAPAPEETAVDFALKLKDAAIAKAKGEDYIAEKRPKKPRDYVAPGIIGVSMCATMLGVISLVRDEKRIIGGTAAALGLAAAVVQWSIIIASVVIFLLLVFLVLSLLGIDISL